MRLVVSLFLSLLALPALAATSDAAKPVDITADSLEVQQQKSQAVFAGNVIATQGEMRLSANRMTVFYKGGSDAPGNAPAAAISRIEAAGNVFLATPQETARGEHGVYHLDRKELQLTGNVSLTRGKNVIRGERLDYSLATGKSTIVAAKGTPGRVRALFVPEKGQDMPWSNEEKSR